MELITSKELWEWRIWAISIATDDISDREVDWLLQSVANVDRLTLRLELLADAKGTRTANGRSIEISMSLDRLTALWLDRVQERKPVQYLIGTTCWRDFELVVSPAVLIPRPETESIIDIALAATDSIQQQGIWVDLGTGSGAIAIAIARSLPAAQIYAVDSSSAALEIAQMNATRLDVLDRINFSHGSWWSSLAHLQGKITVMLSNPPYIPSQEVLLLQPEVAQHEPHLALDGGLDGLDAIRVLVDTAPEYLQAGGIWLIEMMAGQGAAVVALLEQQGSYDDIEIINDLAGLDRFVLARMCR
ncbi:peptide chain release factor N(5)-glutamine methyltransferase [Chamaesiphon sp.]|uniref:peptide chain release factor N(5)-glutamine methyltransferase n=1 Tax=Chamaesiphon sp. TaxID=2814140 RepID=UPI003593F062